MQLGSGSGSPQGVRVGVVGGGYWGSKHVRTLSTLPEVSQVVAVDPCLERVRALAGTYPALQVRATLASALDDVDAVVIATPPRTHAPLALQASKQVMLQSLDEPEFARAMTRRYEAADRMLASDFNSAIFEHFQDACRRARKQRRLADHHVADVDRMKSVHIFFRSDRVDHCLFRNVRRQRQLDEYAVDFRFPIQLPDPLEKLLLSGRCRQSIHF